MVRSVCVCVCVYVMRHWHASGRRPLPLQVTPLTSHLFPVGGEKEEGVRWKTEVHGGMQGCIHFPKHSDEVTKNMWQIKHAKNSFNDSSLHIKCMAGHELGSRYVQKIKNIPAFFKAYSNKTFTIKKVKISLSTKNGPHISQSCVTAYRTSMLLVTTNQSLNKYINI